MTLRSSSVLAREAAAELVFESPAQREQQHAGVRGPWPAGVRSFDANVRQDDIELR